MKNYRVNTIGEKATEKVEKYLRKNAIGFSKQELNNGTEAFMLVTLEDKQVNTLRAYKDVFVDDIYEEVTVLDGLPITHRTVEEDFPFPQPMAENDEEINPLYKKIFVGGLSLAVIIVLLTWIL